MMNKLSPITKNGLLKLEEERNNLMTVERPKIIKAIASARALGDLSENAEYHSAREQQAFIESRISTLDSLIASSKIVELSNKETYTQVQFGLTVTLLDIDTDKETQYTIVGSSEIDLDKGYISYQTPLAKAMMNKGLGSEVTLSTPSNTKYYEIIKIEYVES